MTLSLLEPLVGAVNTAGYAFPGTAQLILGYLERGHHVTALTTGTDLDAPLRRSSPQLALVVLPARGSGRDRAFDFFRRERRALQAEIDAARADVVHAHWTYEFGLAARAARTPALVTVHDWAPAIAKHNRHPYWYFRWAMQVACLVRPGALSAPSEYIASRVRRVYRHPCEVIPNGVDLHPFQTARADRGAAPVVAMLNVGFTGRKNVTTALRAWPAVRAAHPGALLVLAGPEYEPGGLAAEWAAQQDLLDGVRFDGPLDPAAIPAWMAAADVFLHTSREESFGIVLVEAMAAGVPVVAGIDSGAPPDVLGDAGRLVDVGDPYAVARAVADLLADTAEADRLRERGRARAVSYDLAAVVDRCLAALAALAGRPAPADGTARR